MGKVGKKDKEVQRHRSRHKAGTVACAVVVGKVGQGITPWVGRVDSSHGEDQEGRQNWQSVPVQPAIC